MFSLQNRRDTRIPVKIEIAGAEFRKNIGWTTVGYTMGSLLAGPIGGVIGGLTQGNGQNVKCTVYFEDGSEKTITCKDKNLQFELFVWTWRIEHCKSEQDYVDFGLDFNTLERGKIVKTDRVGEVLNFDPENKSLKELWGGMHLYLALHKLFKLEIERYFWEQRKERVLLETDTGGLKIPPKFDLISFCIYGFVLFVIASAIMQNCTKQPESQPNYLPTESESR
ncbi:hypothetical protein N0824_02499 [Microcystis sp. 0824]|uniref:hypothetical protein n=1 Tax=Microcystis sp. 0824 TaxID=1502726 RepID=UPI000D0C03B9|nr:hypothetical protein [Microcystis sp. 0824]GBF54631.1 hypothetical protein N0824_02499 [Microcystis sp. 0824]